MRFREPREYRVHLTDDIRHKGYVTWDDDIDIWMPRPDYMKFMKEFKHPYYSAYCAEYTPGWDHFIAKVCDDRTIIDEGLLEDDSAITGHYSKVMRHFSLWSCLHYTQHMKIEGSNGIFLNSTHFLQNNAQGKD